GGASPHRRGGAASGRAGRGLPLRRPLGALRKDPAQVARRRPLARYVALDGPVAREATGEQACEQPRRPAPASTARAATRRPVRGAGRRLTRGAARGAVHGRPTVAHGAIPSRGAAPAPRRAARNPVTDPIPLDEASLPAYLRRLGLLAPGESVRIEPAGDGNINWVRRARTADRSFVVKQARPALERFPRYRAPTARIGFEARWLETVARLDEAGVCPRVERFDPAARVLVLEDLGDAPRLDAVLAAGPAPRRPAPDAVAAAIRLARFLGRVHAATSARPELPARFRNDGMQRLHGEHVFALPFRPNDFPLAPPVRERAEQIQREGRVAAVAE